MNRTLYLLLLLALTACEREINLDYHSVEPLYVVEAAVTNEHTRVRITTTRDVDVNTVQGSLVENATVVVTSADGYDNETLRYIGNGFYESGLTGYPGVRYTVDVEIDGRHFTSSSTMQEEPVMNSFRFVWKRVLTEDLLFADLRLQDRPAQTNYYFMHIYRNGVGYRWAVLRDDGNPGGELQQLFTCTTRREMEKADSDDALRDGDAIRVEIRAIDRPAYDYLYSMQLMDNTGTNPVANFTGGCLGYFSAYSVIAHLCVFRLEDVEEEE